MHFGHFWPPRTLGGGFGGSAEAENDIIVLRPFLALECIVLGHNNLLHYDFGVLGQNRALRAKKGPFWAKIGFAEKWIFLKNIDSNFDENARKVLLGVNNEVKKMIGVPSHQKIFTAAKLKFLVQGPFWPLFEPWG